MKKKSLLMGAAMAGLVLASSNTMAAGHADHKEAKAKEVKCYGVNSCKGHGSCAGKVNSCNGKNGCSTKLKCAGMNSCKGKGLKKMTKKACKKKGGMVAS